MTTQRRILGLKLMMNLKGLGRKRPWPNCKVIFRHSTGITEENHGKRQSG
jgi:hypothetical protein